MLLNNKELINKLNAKKQLSYDEWYGLLSSFTEDDRAYAAEIARALAKSIFGKKIYIRGIVEFSNYCKCNCYYCGIRNGNKEAVRYRLTKEDILACCREGYEYGFRTFVLQSGEDPYFTDEMLVDIVSAIRNEYSDCAITLSLGERSEESYKKLYEAGADRYLLRHETADAEHYGKLHPQWMSWQNRMDCLKSLKKTGFQTGCGLMVGSPYQTVDSLVKDMLFITDFKPHMIGIGPFVPHKDTPFCDFEAGNIPLNLFLLSLCRIALPDILLPATTALGAVCGDDGRLMGILSGCNVIMPNLSPIEVRKKYMLYDNKPINSDDAAESIEALKKYVAEIGYEITVDRGDYGKICTNR